MRRRLKSEGHDAVRTFCRVAGPILALLGFGLFAAGIISFTRGFGDFEGGFGDFWMCFVGAPIGAAGIFLIKVGYLGAASRYVAGETAPVARDTIDYLARGTKDAVREVADAIRGEGDEQIGCPECGEDNDADARFCKACGSEISGPYACPACGEPADPDANFCDACGKALRR